MPVGAFTAPDVEEFLVFTHAGAQLARTEVVDLSADELAACRDPLWTVPGSGGAKRHPYQSPANVIRRFVALYSAAGDLVVDPFAGGGTTLRVATALGRRAIGYEIDAALADNTSRVLAGGSRQR